MEFFLWLLLAHFIGDYPFQTSWVYEQKMKGFFGMQFHAFGILAAMILVLVPYLWDPQIWAMMISITVVHYCQDLFKISFKGDQGNQLLLPGYFIDQILHYGFIFFFWWFFFGLETPEPAIWADVYQNSWYPLFLIGFVLVTFVWDVTLYIFALDKLGVSFPFRRDWWELFWRGSVYTVIFLIYLLLQYAA